MTYIKELRNYFKFDNKLSRFRGPTQFATEFFKMVFGEDFEQAVEEMYDREIKEHRDKWYDACIEMFRLRCEEIPRECSEGV